MQGFNAVDRQDLLGDRGDWLTLQRLPKGNRPAGGPDRLSDLDFSGLFVGWAVCGGCDALTGPSTAGHQCSSADRDWGGGMLVPSACFPPTPSLVFPVLCMQARAERFGAAS